jgi:hypothetical protein
MNWGERFFVAVCSIIVLAMIGPVNLAAGVIMAAFVGLLMWGLFTMLPGEEPKRR